MTAMYLRRAHCIPLLTGITMALTTPIASAAKLARIHLEPGEQKTWALPGKVVRAATANEKIVGVNVVPPSGVILTAKAPGSVMVSFWEEGKSVPSSQIMVVVDMPATVAKDALGSDQGKARIDTIGTSLRMTGELSSLEKHESAAETMSAQAQSIAATAGGGAAGTTGASTGGNRPAVIDNSRSGFDVQVQLDVKVVEVSRSKLKSAGFYADRYSGTSTLGLSGPSNLSAFVTDPAAGTRTITSSSGFVPKADAFNIFRWGANSLTVFSALESNGFAYTLAEPSLTALSGQTAVFLAGGELPVPLSTGLGNVSVNWKEFGIRLGMTPTVLDNDRIAVKLAPEVSEIDSSLSITLGGLTVPGLRVRRTETTVATGDGETFVISGLVSQQSTSDVDKFPFLGDIPILGAFFRSSHFDREDKELLMIVTPHLVRPFAKDAKLPELPGQEIKDYDPGYLRFLFLENGKFTQPDTGFSR